MKIAIDISPLKTGNYLQHRVRGTGFYLEHLKSSLLKYFPDNIYEFFVRGQKLTMNPDIFHIPYFEPFFPTLPLRKISKTVVTVHDLTPFVFPKEFPAGIKGKLYWKFQKLFLKHADAIVTDSECSKNDILKFIGISEEKVHVVLLAAGEEFKKISLSQSILKKYNIPPKFALYVGDATWNKNLPRLVRAAKAAEIPLVMVGKALVDNELDESNPWNKDLDYVRLFAKNNPFIHRLGFVPTEDLVALYNTAAFFVMPSLYEGFGLPLLEAMSCGCPVVTSKEGSIPEVAGDAALYADAYNEHSIAEKMKIVFSDKKKRIELSKIGIQQSKKFLWEKTATNTMEVYKQIASGII